MLKVQAIKRVAAFELFRNIVRELSRAISGLTPEQPIATVYRQLRPVLTPHLVHLERLEARLFASQFPERDRLLPVVQGCRRLTDSIRDVTMNNRPSVTAQIVIDHLDTRLLVSLHALVQRHPSHWLREDREPLLAGAERLLGIS